MFGIETSNTCVDILPSSQLLCTRAQHLGEWFIVLYPLYPLPLYPVLGHEYDDRNGWQI